MNFIPKAALAFACLSVIAHAQFYRSPGVILVGTAPSGSCSGANAGQLVVSTGTLYTCQSGTWAAIAGGGGSMVYPGAGIPVSTGTAWGTSKTAPSGAIVGTTDTQTLTNKTIDGVTPATMVFVDPTSSIQTQLNAKQGTVTLTTTGTSGTATFSSNTLNIPQYQGALSLTTTGTSGAATLVGNTLNIPQYAGGGSGTVTTVSVATANGVSGTVATATTTPAITLTLGAITPTSVAATGAVSGTSITAGAGSTVCGSASGCWAALGGSTAGTPASGSAYTRFDSTSNLYKSSLNGGTEFTSLMSYAAPATSCGDATHALGWSGTALNCQTLSGGSSGLSGMTASQVPIAATATTVTSSKALAGAGAAITTGPTSATAADIAIMAADGSIYDSGSHVYDLAQRIVGDLVTFSTTAVAANSCSTAASYAATYLDQYDFVSNMVVGDSTSVSGYGAGQLQIQPPYIQITSGSVVGIVWKVCNPTAASITPAALSAHFEVYR